MADIGEQVIVCFDETYWRVDWNVVLEAGYKRINEVMSKVLNPQILMLFQKKHLSSRQTTIDIKIQTMDVRITYNWTLKDVLVNLFLLVNRLRDWYYLYTF